MEDLSRENDEQLTFKRAGMLGLTYLDVRTLPDRRLYSVLPVADIKALRIVPIEATTSTILFGITTTTGQSTMSQMRNRFQDQRITFVIISDKSFQEYVDLYDPPKKIEYQDIAISVDNDSSLIDQVSRSLESVRSDDILAYLVSQAYRLKASDIHLETTADKIRVRLRVDGVLHPVAYVNKDKYRQLSSSIAVAANVSSSSKDAQTGHIHREDTMADGSKVPINLRVETVPTIYGQDAVLRLFNFKPEFLQLSMLGLASWETEIIQDIIQHPNGLVMVVGPTGSGKTTTLYSMINALNTPERKIITLEDPVEYNVEGIVQIPIDTRKNDLGFSERLRAVLRLDPDIIMIGEIRDLDTAKTALQASLTGHLVLSTYHGSSSAAALSRLIDATGENPLMISAIRLIAAQRLVRLLDDQTKIAYQPDQPIRDMIAKILADLPPGFTAPDLQNITLYRPGSSPECPFGYRGQTAVREFMRMTPEVIEVLKRPTGQINAQDIEAAAKGSGMLTMRQDAILKALAGITSLEEIARVVG